MSRAVKVKELDGKVLLKKEETASLRGTIVVFDPEKSEIAKKIGAKEKGSFGMKFK